MSKDKISYFGVELSAARLCLKCGYVGQLIRSVRRCPECHAPFPKRSNEYDEAVRAALAEQNKQTTKTQEEEHGKGDRG